MMVGLPWFGPKRGFGWGWTAVTWQGWVLTAAVLAAILFLCYGPAFRYRLPALVLLLAAYLGVVLLTGTRPGGSWS